MVLELSIRTLLIIAVIVIAIKSLGCGSSFIGNLLKHFYGAAMIAEGNKK